MMEVLHKNGIPLDTCPTSNLHTGAVKDFSAMKKLYRTLIDHGVLFTINTDGPEMNKTSLRREYAMLLEESILSPKEILAANTLAHSVSFLSTKGGNTHDNK